MLHWEAGIGELPGVGAAKAKANMDAKVMSLENIFVCLGRERA